MTQEQQRFIRDSDAFNLARELFRDELKTAKKNKDDHHCDMDDILVKTLKGLASGSEAAKSKDPAMLTLSTYYNSINIKISPNPKDYTSLKQSLARLLYVDELNIYRKQRSIRKTCYTTLFISASVIGTIGVAEAAGLEQCAHAFNLRSPDWSNGATWGLAIALIVCFIATIALLKIKMNQLDRNELTQLGTLGDLTDHEIKDQLSIFDIHPLKIPKEIRRWFKENEGRLEGPISFDQRPESPQNGDEEEDDDDGIISLIVDEDPSKLLQMLQNYNYKYKQNQPY